MVATTRIRLREGQRASYRVSASGDVLCGWVEIGPGGTFSVPRGPAEQLIDRGMAEKVEPRWWQRRSR